MSTAFVLMTLITTVPHFDDSVFLFNEKAICFDDVYYLFTVEKKENNYFGRQTEFYNSGEYVFQETVHEGFIYISKTSTRLKEKYR